MGNLVGRHTATMTIIIIIRRVIPQHVCDIPATRGINARAGCRRARATTSCASQRCQRDPITNHPSQFLKCHNYHKISPRMSSTAGQSWPQAGSGWLRLVLLMESSIDFAPRHPLPSDMQTPDLSIIITTHLCDAPESSDRQDLWHVCGVYYSRTSGHAKRG
jgi:hypothetical protein